MKHEVWHRLRKKWIFWFTLSMVPLYLIMAIVSVLDIPELGFTILDTILYIAGCILMIAVLIGIVQQAKRDIEHEQRMQALDERILKSLIEDYLSK